MSKKSNVEKKKKKKKKNKVPGLTDTVFSWSFEDVLNNNLYKDQVKNIPKTFQSTDEYKSSFVLPLIEETHADLRSTFENMRNPPTREAMSIEMLKKKSNSKTLVYKMKLKRSTNVGDCNYKPHSGDLIALTSTRPNNIHDFRRPGQAYLVAYVQGHINEDPDLLKILSSGPVVSEHDPPEFGRRELLFAVHLVNLTTNNRIYEALDTEHKGWNLKVINQVLQKNSSNGENCEACYSIVNQSKKYSEIRSILESSNLNDSQGSAILSGICLKECTHQSSVKLIWGPPGTGKTKTTGLLLFCLLKLKCRTLTCAPTNTAVLEVAKRLMSSVINSFGHETYGFGDVVLFGNKDRMKICDEDVLGHVFLDHRVKVLLKCGGYNHSLATMIKLLGVSEEKEMTEKGVVQDDQTSNTRRNLKQNQKKMKGSKNKSKLETFVRTFNIAHERLEFCMVGLCTHLPTSLVSQQVVEKMKRALDLLITLKRLLSGAKQFLSYGLEGAVARKDCLCILKSLEQCFKLPKLTNKRVVEKFCLAKARLIFCTASSSAKLHRGGMGVELLVIDEAAQLKECESTIPLQTSGLRHAILIGDERQLPAMVQSKISGNAEFGRSLFERLVLVGHKKHLLNVQYRMLPSISMFPNREFYDMQIMDAPLVRETSYNRQFLEGNMYGSVSFINVAYGKEQLYEGCSTRNMVEVFVVSEILATLYKEVVKSKKKMSVGVISPYKAQVHAIQEKISKSYSSNKVDKGFSVNVKSVDGFQGSEEDVIIISTVRSNVNGSVGFLSNFQRANVALTRARYCLWIVGNGSTLVNSNSIWKSLVMDARDRGCFFDAEDDERLSQAMVASLVELGQFDTLFQRVCLLFRKSIWKVCFCDKFMKSLVRVKDKRISKEIVSVIEKISHGWRQTHKRRSSIVVDGVSSQVLEKYKVCGGLKLVWSIDILREDSDYMQVIKVWDVVPDTDVPNLAKSLDMLFGDYSASKMKMCKDKSIQGNLVVPMKWVAEHEDVQSLSRSLASMTIEDESSKRVLELELN